MDKAASESAGSRAKADPAHRRPRSPNIQIYRPQFTSVLSIANRIAGVALGIGVIFLVAWLLAVASGPEAYAVSETALTSISGKLILFCFTFSFFFHLCGGIRHLVWETVHAYDLRSIYIGGWAVVVASTILTVAS